MRSLAPSADAQSTDSWPFGWSPNSRFLLVSGPGQSVLIIDVRQRRRRTVRLDQFFTGGNFSPNSSTAVIGREEASASSATQSVFALPVTGQRRRLVTRNGSQPVWGRGGIAFSRPLPSPAQLLVTRGPGRKARVVMRTSDPILFAVAWSADGHTLLAAEGPNPTSLRALLIDPITGSVTTLAPTFSAIEALSRDGTSVLGEIGGNVASVSATGTETILATNATAPSWNR